MKYRVIDPEDLSKRLEISIEEARGMVAWESLLEACKTVFEQLKKFFDKTAIDLKQYDEVGRRPRNQLEQILLAAIAKATK